MWDWLVQELTEGSEVTVQPGGVGEPVTYRATNRVEVLPEDRGIRIACFHGHDLSPAMTLHMTPARWARHLRETAEDGVEAFGTRNEGGIVEAFALFLVHLEEAVDGQRPWEDHMVLSRGGLDPLRTPPHLIGS